MIEDYEAIENMTDLQAAEVLENMSVRILGGRANGKTILCLTYNKALEKAIQKLKDDKRIGVWLPLKSLMEDNHHSRLSFRCDQCRYVEGYRAKYCAGCGAFMRAKEMEVKDD